MSKRNRKRNKKQHQALQKQDNTRKSNMGHGNMYNYGDEYYKKYNTPSTNYSNKKSFVVLAKDTGDTYEMETYSDTEFNKLKDHFEFVDGKEPIIMVSKSDLRFKKSYRQVMTCAYDATEKFLESLLGRKLSSADKDWYKELPMMVSSGLPAQYTLTVLNELVKPYGVGISHVFYSKKPVMNDDIAAWQKVLGVNPIGLTSRDTSNEEYLAIAASDENGDLNPLVVDVIKPQLAGYNFEYTDQIQSPCIVFQDMANASYAGGGGHASYRGPRERPGTARIAIQYDYIERCKWLCEPPTLPVMDPTVNWELDFSECLTKDGVPWKDVRYKSTYSPSTSPIVKTDSPKGFVPSVSKVGGPEKTDKWVAEAGLTEAEARKFIADLGLTYGTMTDEDLSFDLEYADKIMVDVKKILDAHNSYSIYYEHGAGYRGKPIEEVLQSKNYLDQKAKKAIYDILLEMEKAWFSQPTHITIADAFVVNGLMQKHGSNQEWWADVISFSILSNLCTLSSADGDAKEEKVDEPVDDGTLRFIDTTEDFVKFAMEYYGTQWASNQMSLMYNPRTIKSIIKALNEVLSTEEVKKQIQGYPEDVQIPTNHKYWFLWRTAIDRAATPIIEEDDISLAEIFLISNELRKDKELNLFNNLVTTTLVGRLQSDNKK